MTHLDGEGMSLEELTRAEEALRESLIADIIKLADESLSGGQTFVYPNYWFDRDSDGKILTGDYEAHVAPLDNRGRVGTTHNPVLVSKYVGEKPVVPVTSGVTHLYTIMSSTFGYRKDETDVYEFFRMPDGKIDVAKGPTGLFSYEIINRYITTREFSANEIGLEFILKRNMQEGLEARQKEEQRTKGNRLTRGIRRIRDKLAA
ncbi:MAG TPA: hypothetical protein VJC09_01165 [Candidatus Saccharimonadales bacterium]|nr:hypothetical protein [Candidatus Saccharimonadales bacterium]